MNSLNKLIDEVKNEFAPDKRVAVFQIDISTDSGKIILNGETNLFKAKEKLINGLNSLHFEYVDKIAILPSPDLEDKIYGLVNLSVANIRTLP
ncbi:MAG: glycoside hydrolase, partial [Ignavibacteria bacterium]|nr:glycoside hydrolase [Ignavibacteria bacterium]